MATSDDIKKRALELSEKTDSNSITPKEVGGIMYDLASLVENAIRNGGTLGIRKVYASVAAMEADSTYPVDFWGNPIKKGNLVAIYDGTTTGLENNKIYAFMNPGWELATKLDAAYATRSEVNSKIVQETGEGENVVMSQKAVTAILDDLESKIGGVTEKNITVKKYEHSSDADAIKTDISKGEFFSVSCTAVSAQIGQVAIYVTNKDTGVKSLLSTIPNGTTVEYVAPYNISLIGYYFEVQKEGIVKLEARGGFKEEVKSHEAETKEKFTVLNDKYSKSSTKNGANAFGSSQGEYSVFEFKTVDVRTKSLLRYEGNATDGSTSSQIYFYEIRGAKTNSETGDLLFYGNRGESIVNGKEWIIPSGYNIIRVYLRFHNTETATFKLTQETKYLPESIFEEKASELEESIGNNAESIEANKERIEKIYYNSADKVSRQLKIQSKSEHSSKSDMLWLDAEKNSIVYVYVNPKKQYVVSDNVAAYIYYKDGTSELLKTFYLNSGAITFKVDIKDRYDGIGLYVFNSTQEDIEIDFSIFNDRYRSVESIGLLYPLSPIELNDSIVGKGNLNYSVCTISNSIKAGTMVNITISPSDELTFPVEGQSKTSFIEIIGRSGEGNIPLYKIYNTDSSKINKPIVIEKVAPLDLTSIDIYVRALATESAKIRTMIGSTVESFVNPSLSTIGLKSSDFEQGGIYTGIETTDTKVSRSKYLSCYGLRTLDIHSDDDSVYFRIAFYDKDKAFISDVMSESWIQVKKIGVPKGVSFFRICTLKRDSSGNAIVLKPSDYIDDINLRVSQGNEDISSGSIAVGDDIEAFNPDADEKILALKSLPGRYGKNKNNILPAFMVTTDIHSDWTRFARACDFAESHKGIDFNVTLGDFGDHPANFRAFDYRGFTLGYTKPILNVAGNHEFWYEQGFTEEEIAEKLWSDEMKAHNGDIHPVGKNYWHKDIQTVIDDVTHTLRIIAPYEYECPVQPTDGQYPTQWAKATIYWTQEQIDWLIGLLDSCDENTHVMILLHYPPCEVKFTNHEWNDRETKESITNEAYNSASDPLFLIKIIDAWIKGERVAYNMSFAPDFSEEFVSDVVVDHTFVGHQGRFAGILHGHSHLDAESCHYSYDNIKCIGFPNTSSAEIQNQNDTSRMTVGKTQDSVTVVSYDFILNKVRLLRLGSTVTTRMTKKEITRML